MRIKTSEISPLAIAARELLNKGDAVGAEVSLPAFAGFLQQGHVRPLGLRLVRSPRS